MLKELLAEKTDKINIYLKEVDEISKIAGTSVLTIKGKRSLLTFM